MEAQPNMLSISFSDSKGSGENVNSERRRDKIALALQLAAKNSPVDSYQIQGRPGINTETNYPRYEERYEVLDPSTSSQITNDGPMQHRPEQKARRKKSFFDSKLGEVV